MTMLFSSPNITVTLLTMIYFERLRLLNEILHESSLTSSGQITTDNDALLFPFLVLELTDPGILHPARGICRTNQDIPYYLPY